MFQWRANIILAANAWASGDGAEAGNDRPSESAGVFVIVPQAKHTPIANVTSNVETTRLLLAEVASTPGRKDQASPYAQAPQNSVLVIVAMTNVIGAACTNFISGGVNSNHVNATTRHHETMEKRTR